MSHVRLIEDHGHPDSHEQLSHTKNCLETSDNNLSLLNSNIAYCQQEAIVDDTSGMLGHVNLAAELEDNLDMESSLSHPRKNKEEILRLHGTESQEPSSKACRQQMPDANPSYNEKKKKKMQMARIPDTDSKQICLPDDNRSLQPMARPDIIPFIPAGTPILHPPSAPACERVLVHNTGRAAQVQIGHKTIINGPVTYICPDKKEISDIPIIDKVEHKKFPWSYLDAYSRRCKIFTFAAIFLLVTIAVLAVVLTRHGDVIPKPECPKNGSQIISRGEWFARKPVGPLPELASPVPFVIITQKWVLCNTLTACTNVMIDTQEEAFSNNQSDILYNFLIGGDGNVYVGRGWTKAGYLGTPIDSEAVNIALLVGVKFAPSDCQVNALTKILNEGLINKNLTSNYTIVPLKDVLSSVTIPSDKIIDAIKQLPHFIKQQLHRIT